jgi:hypothetical protein
MLAQRIDLGPVSLFAAPGWRFFPCETQIVCRSDTRVGGMRMSLQLVNRVPPPRSNTESASLAKMFAPPPSPDEPPIHDVHTWAGARLAGAVTYASGQDYVRLYYIHEDSSLLPIWYACKLDRRADHDCEREISACDMMVASIQLRPEVVPPQQLPVPVVAAAPFGSVGLAST